MKTKRRILTTLAVFMMAAAFLFTLVACAVTGVGGKNPSSGSSAKPSAKKVYAFSAMLSASMMPAAFGSKSAPNAVAADAKFAEADAEARPDLGGAELEELNRYLKMFEGYLVGNGVNETVTAPTEADGEYAGYTYKVSMEVPRLDGEKDGYLFYYSEFDQKTDVKLDFEADDDDDEDEENETEQNAAETETSSRLEGVLILAETVYPVEGKKSVETEEGETETEIEFTTRLEKDDNQNYIEVKQSLETETDETETEYEYKIVKDGKIVSKTKIEIETDAEENEQEVNLSFFDTSGTKPLTTKYAFEREYAADGTAEIVIKVKEAGKAAQIIRVKAEADGSYRYLFENGYEEVYSAQNE